MNEELISLILTIGFGAIIIVFAVISLIAIYIVIKYGRTRSITIFASMAFASLFVLQAIAAFATLSSIN